MENNTIVLTKADKSRIWKKNNVALRSAQMQRRRMRFKVTEMYNNILLPDDYPYYA